MVGTVALDHRQVTRGHPEIARHIDALDIDRRCDLPVDARLPGRHQVHRAAVEADDGDLVRLRLHRLEQLGGQIGPRGLQHRVTLRGEFGANDVEDLRRQLTRADRTAGDGRVRARARACRCASATRARHPSPSASSSANARSWHASMVCPPALAGSESGFRLQRTWGRGRRFLKARRAGFELARRRAHARDRSTCVERSNGATRHQRKRYPPRRKAGLTVSRFGRKALRQYGRTATEARVRSPSMGISFSG